MRIKELIPDLCKYQYLFNVKPNTIQHHTTIDFITIDLILLVLVSLSIYYKYHYNFFIVLTLLILVSEVIYSFFCLEGGFIKKYKKIKNLILSN